MQIFTKIEVTRRCFLVHMKPVTKDEANKPYHFPKQSQSFVYATTK